MLRIRTYNPNHTSAFHNLTTITDPFNRRFYFHLNKLLVSRCSKKRNPHTPSLPLVILRRLLLSLPIRHSEKQFLLLVILRRLPKAVDVRISDVKTKNEILTPAYGRLRMTGERGRFLRMTRERKTLPQDDEEREMFSQGDVPTTHLTILEKHIGQ